MENVTVFMIFSILVVVITNIFLHLFPCASRIVSVILNQIFIFNYYLIMPKNYLVEVGMLNGKPIFIVRQPVPKTELFVTDSPDDLISHLLS